MIVEFGYPGNLLFWRSQDYGGIIVDMIDALKSKQSFEEKLSKAKQRGKKTDSLSSETTGNRLPRFYPGGMPNHINRSSLIAPIGRGQRIHHSRSILKSRSDCTIEYTGEQLDEADGDILMALLCFAQGTPLGTPFELRASKLLAAIRRSNGNSQYKWLLRRIRKMTESTLYIETRQDAKNSYQVGKLKAFHIIAGFEYTDSTQSYSFKLDADWLKLFANREFSLISWEKRMQISGQLNIAKALQRLISTDSNKCQHYNLALLKETFAYSGRMNDFCTSLKKNIDELIRVGIIYSGEIRMSSKGTLQLVVNVAGK